MALSLYEEQEAKIIDLEAWLNDYAEMMERYCEQILELLLRAEKAEALLENEEKVCTQLAYQCDDLIAENLALQDQLDKAEQQLANDQLEHVRLEARNRKLRAALTELCLWHRPDGDCWCRTVSAHTPGCLLAKEALTP
jgi:hypothetical protein